MLLGRRIHPAALASFALIAMAASAHADGRPLAKDPRHDATRSPPTTFVLPSPFTMPTGPRAPMPTGPRAPTFEVVLDAATGGSGVPAALVAAANLAIVNELRSNFLVQVVPTGAPATAGRPRFVLRPSVTEVDLRAGGRARVCVSIAVHDPTRIRGIRRACASASGPSPHARLSEQALAGAVRGALRSFSPP